MKRNTEKLVMNIPAELNNKYKTMAENMGVPKSYLVITALTQYLDSKEALKILGKFVDESYKPEEEK